MIPGDSALPPLVPADVDLRDFPYTPIFRAMLFGSSFHARATDSEWRAGMTLWLKSWDQVPAGSLPPDDIALCRLAELGRDVDAWLAVSAMALYGFVLCSDGRLHHPVIAETVLDAWAKRRHSRNRKRTWREANKLVPGTSRGRPRGRVGDVPDEEKKGKEERSLQGRTPLEPDSVLDVGSRGDRATVVPIKKPTTSTLGRG